MNAEQLNAIKERAASTSFAKAYIKGDPWKGYEVRDEGNGQTIAETSSGTDAEFISHAYSDIPVLVAEVERLNSVKHRLNSDVELYRKQYEGAQIQLNESEAENARLRKALEYYADEKHYEPYGAFNTGSCDITEDEGYIAREALSNGEESNAL